jgi:hypothetical protein
VDSETLYRAINAVEPTLIRVDADEVTYNLHILLRFEIEQRLFKGELAVRDLPATWNALSGEIVGLVPPNDTLGVLQDVHWSGGAFGYFPSYCIGNMMAAQLWYTVLREIPGLESDFARGDFSRLLGWLRTKIHREGRRHDTLALVQRVTGEPLSPRHLFALPPGTLPAALCEAGRKCLKAGRNAKRTEQGAGDGINRHTHTSGILPAERRTAGRADACPGGGCGGDDHHWHVDG